METECQSLVIQTAKAVKEACLKGERVRRKDDEIKLEKYARIIEELRFQNWKLMEEPQRKSLKHDDEDAKSMPRFSNDNRQFLDADLKEENPEA